jgi:four helix bundle protein
MDYENKSFQNHNFEKLVIWQRAMKLTMDIYIVAKKLPKEELFAITSQIKRSAVSVPSNIAEGSKRSTNKDFRHFIYIFHRVLWRNYIPR